MAGLMKMMEFLQTYVLTNPPPPSKNPDPIRFGVLGAATINPLAILLPVASHPDAVVVAVAARDLDRAKKQADKYHVPRAYASYDELLEQPDIDAVFIGLPNGLHAEWTIRALKAGKHVLVEKPIANNATEARAILECAKKYNKHVLEAFHYQFHPALHALHDLVQGGRYGKIIRTETHFPMAAGTIPAHDIRYNYKLGGGTLMDFTYVVSVSRYLTDCAGPADEIVSAKAKPLPFPNADNRIDAGMDAEMRIKDPHHDGHTIKTAFHCDSQQPLLFGFLPRFWATPDVEVELEHATLLLPAFVQPTFYHYIKIHDRRTNETTYQKFYKGGPKWGPLNRGETWWTTYRYQLEAFVMKVKGEQEPPHWISLEESVAQMETIDKIYEKAGMPKRGLEDGERDLAL